MVRRERRRLHRQSSCESLFLLYPLQLTRAPTGPGGKAAPGLSLLRGRQRKSKSGSLQAAPRSVPSSLCWFSLCSFYLTSSFLSKKKRERKGGAHGVTVLLRGHKQLCLSQVPQREGSGVDAGGRRSLTSQKPPPRCLE